MNSIAIAGGGFSGTMVLANLVALAPPGSLRIGLFEASETVGEGAAYGTKDSAHLLNVRADRMGAFPGKPEGFWEWLQSTEGRQAAEEWWPGHEPEAETFIPRVVYGVYVKQILRIALAEARVKKIEVKLHRAALTDAKPQKGRIGLLAVTDDRGQSFEADRLVLATGNLPPRRLAAESEYYLDNAWKVLREASFRDKVSRFPAESIIVIVGTGLTMVDAVLTLQAQGFKGRIVAISRHGKLPQPHAEVKAYPAWDWVLDPAGAPRTALGLFAGLRAEIRKAAKAGYDWRSMVDSLRPVTQPIWQGLVNKERRKFLKRLSTLWNIHRHRMAPEIHAKLVLLQQNGKLDIIAANLLRAAPAAKTLEVHYRIHGTGGERMILAALMLNCTGPQYDITKSEHPLLHNLSRRGLIIPSALQAGIELTPQGDARGAAPGAILPIGPLMVGEALESTAVPELREIARRIAKRILTPQS